MSYSFSTLRKKIEKVDSMLKDLDSSDEQYQKLQNKRGKYYEQMKQTPEWETEGPAIERREELKKKARQLRETANRAEKTRKKAEEARLEKERQAREETQRKKREREEAKRRSAEERLEKQRLERERLEQERLKREREYQERLEQERGERERREQERLQREREEKKRLEQERLERERREQERLQRERLERDRLEQERLQREREEKERLERERLEQDRLEREREENERLEQERLEREHLEEERLKREREENERERLEKERLEREREENAEEQLEIESEENERVQQVQEASERENEEIEVDSTTNDANKGRQPDSVVALSSDIGRSSGESDDRAAVDAPTFQHTKSIVPSEPAAPPQRRMLGGMGGLLAEIGKKKKQMDATRKPIEDKRVTTLKLVETKSRNDSADQLMLNSPKPQHTKSSVESETTAPPRRPKLGGMGGLLAEIGKKKEQMDAVRKPIEEKRVPKLKLIDPKTVNQNSVDSNSVSKSKLSEPAKYTSRVRGDEKLSEEFLQSRKSTLNLPQSANTETILHELSSTEDYHLKLEKHLKRNGIPIPVDIPYEVCKDKIASITKQMQNLQTTEKNSYTVEKKYFELEQEMMKYSTAMMLTDEWAEEQLRLEQEWEDSVKDENINALKQVRSHIPVNVRSMTEEALSSELTPNGKVLPQSFARKFKRTNVLQLLRVNPRDIEKMHPSYFEGMRTTGLTLTERRALHEHMKGIGAKWVKLKADKNVERKWLWFDGLKSKFKEMQGAYEQHRDDPQSRHVKADRVLDYSEEDYGFPTEATYESSSSQGKAEASDDTDHQTLTPAKPTKKADDAEIMAAIHDRLQLKDPESEADKKLLRELYHAEKRTLLLEKSLKQAGIEIPEDDIPYAEAKAKVAELTEKIKAVAEKMMNTTDAKEAAMLEKEFGNLSTELTRYQNAMMESKEWAAEQQEKEHQWEESVRESNQNALKMIRRHMPVNIRDMSEEDLVNKTTPNGKALPLKIARKFKRTNILLLLRMDPSSIEPMHPSSLESMRTTGLTLTERRALHEHLRDLGPKWKSLSNDKMAERKWMWHDSLRSKFKELVTAYSAYVEKHGADGNASMGNRCLVKADRAIDYSGDYGFPEDAEFKVDSVAKSNLLTMEDIKKRKQEEDGYEEEEPAKPSGFLAAIAGLRK